MNNCIVSIAFSAILLGCGLENDMAGEVSTEDTYITPKVPVSTSVLVTDNRITLTWDSEDLVDEYSVYYSTDYDFEIENYAAYNKGSWVRGITEAEFSFEPSDRSSVYYFKVTAFIDGLESSPTDTLWGTTRFEVSGANNEVVIDHANNLIWDRCPIGMVWDDGVKNCTGEPTGFNWAEAQTEMSKRDTRLAMPDEYMSLTYCLEDGEVKFIEHDVNSTTGDFCSDYSRPSTRFIDELFGLPVLEAERSYMTGYTYYSNSMLNLRTITLSNLSFLGTNRDHPSINLFVLPVKDYVPPK